MSQQHGLPPPPPHPQQGEVYFNVSAAAQQRRPAPQPPPVISTSFARQQGSAGSAGHTPYPYSPVTPGGLHLRAPLPPSGGFGAGSSNPSPLGLSPGGPSGPSAPGMAVPYNPRQWSGHGNHAAYAQQRSPLGRDTREVTGMEAAMPSPPPPYSPESPEPTSAPRAARPSPMLEQGGFVSSPLAQEPSSSTVAPSFPSRGSPQMPMSPAFPPPPGQVSRHRERSASGQRLFNTISSLTGRGKQPVSNGPAAQSMLYAQGGEVVAPPAARRAASTGHIQPSSSVTPPPPRAMTGVSAGRVSPESERWQPGMPLPGPPPGPPPPGTRSQSLNRYPASSSRSNSTASEPQEGALQPSRRAAQPSTLGPVPPTPADWVDQDELQPSNSQPAEPEQTMNENYYQPLRINTGAQRDASLSRRPARRDMSAQGLRERRSKSRAAREGSSSNVMSPVSDDSRRGDILFSPVGGSISQRREHMRKLSGYASLGATAQSGHSPRGTPSPLARKDSPEQISASVLTPPYTPAVGTQLCDSAPKRGLAVPSSASSDRPLSHLLHAPNEEAAGMPAPLSPSRPASSGSMKTSMRLEPFFLQAMERHRAFIEKEACAATDEERLELFANYMVHESRLRRDRYQGAYNAMAGDVVDLTRDMWRSYTRTSKRAITPSTSMSSLDPTMPSWASESQPASAHGNMPSSASSMGEFTPATDHGSVGDSGDLIEPNDSSRQWGEQFKPSLSPIPSMVSKPSTVPDDDSRGRTASRWWEKSSSGSVGRPDRIEKSHRETKYMGVNPALLQSTPQPSPDLVRSTPTPNTTAFAHSPSSYPPEKVGWHDPADFDTPIPTPARPSSGPPAANQLDLSRLITLPPPYPRHHPAVSNSHPALATLRAMHRQLTDTTEIQRIRDSYLDRDWALQRAQTEETKSRRARLRNSMQEKLASNAITFAEAAAAETDFEGEEAERGRAVARANFDDFEGKVSLPLNALLTEKLETADKSIDALVRDLDEGGEEVGEYDQPQEEGDQLPERLEKLTLLKWLFEAREGLCREVFELHGRRGEKYGGVVLAGLKAGTGDYEAKKARIEEAERFFAKDAIDRSKTFAKESAARFETLVSVVERNVSRGVEGQVSAFWDIAPGLLEVVQCVPVTERELDYLAVAIPEEEYAENPGLRQWPLQYLWSLLSHARMSAYQFIEAQVNLLCLLHEVKGARAKARRKAAGGGGEDVERDEERALDRELKEKVREVEGLWREALGEGVEGARGAVRQWLEVRGGWSEELEE